MLVYANHFRFLGDNAPEAVFKAIGAWLKEQLGYGLTPARLRTSGEHKGQRRRDAAKSYVRIYAAETASPSLYAWVLKHPDVGTRGRQ